MNGDGNQHQPINTNQSTPTNQDHHHHNMTYFWVIDAHPQGNADINVKDMVFDAIFNAIEFGRIGHFFAHFKAQHCELFQCLQLFDVCDVGERSQGM